MGSILMKIKIKKLDWDDTLGMKRPAILPKDWKSLADNNMLFKQYSQLREFFTNEDGSIRNSDSIKSQINYWETDFIEKNDSFTYDINKGDKYFYYIPMHITSYFYEFEDIGFKYIEEDVKSDIRKGLCKILLIAPDEGYFGMESERYGESNYDLELIQKWIDLERFPIDSVIFMCMNMVVNKTMVKKQLPFDSVPYSCVSEAYLTDMGVDWDKEPEIELLPENYKLFLTYNKSFHYHRLYLLYKLYFSNLLEHGKCSFDLSEYSTPIQEQYDRLNLMMKLNGFSQSDMSECVFNLPLKIEDDDSDENYQDVDFFGQITINKHYKNTFVSVVSETLTASDTVYFSEKTFKPIFRMHPFLLISSPNSLKRLKELGYQTFDKWWDESYDEADTFEERIDMIVNILEDLKSKSHEELNKMKLEMRDVLVNNFYNYKHRNAQKYNPLVDSIQERYEHFCNQEQNPISSFFKI